MLKIVTIPRDQAICTTFLRCWLYFWICHQFPIKYIYSFITLPNCVYLNTCPMVVCTIISVSRGTLHKFVLETRPGGPLWKLSFREVFVIWYGWYILIRRPKILMVNGNNSIPNVYWIWRYHRIYVYRASLPCDDYQKS